MRPMTLSDPIDWRGIVGGLLLLSVLLALPASASTIDPGGPAQLPCPNCDLSDGPDPVGMILDGPDPTHRDPIRPTVTILVPGAKEQLAWNAGDFVIVKVWSMDEARAIIGRNNKLVAGVIVEGAEIQPLGKCDNIQDCEKAVSDMCRDLYNDGRTQGVCTVQQQPSGGGSCEMQCRNGAIITFVCVKPAPAAPHGWWVH